MQTITRLLRMSTKTIEFDKNHDFAKNIILSKILQKKAFQLLKML